MDENTPNLQNEFTQSKKDQERVNNLLSKEVHEEFLKYKLSLRKNKIHNNLMEKRIKKDDKNSNIKINNRKKLYEFKKLFEIENIQEAIEKIVSKNSNINYLKDKKIIEMIHLYSQHLNSNDNVKNILGINIDKLLNIFSNEIINDINSQFVDYELFDYYLIIIGNLLIYKKSINDNKDNEYLSLILNILINNSNLEIYHDYNFDIINNTLWLIYLYIYFSDNLRIITFPTIIKIVNDLFTNRFFEEMMNFYSTNKNGQISLTIIKEILFSCIHIYLSIFENLLEENKKEKININIKKEDLQHCLDILIKMINFEVFKDKFNEDITYIISLILALTTNELTFNLTQFYEIYISLFEKYKDYDYDNKTLSQNLISILYYLIGNYYEDNTFFQILNESNIIPICIQNYLKNGSTKNIALNALNMIFKYPFHYHKIIIKSINYQLLDNICEIIINIDNNEKTIYGCLLILINAYSFLDNNMKNPSNTNILKYFDSKLISKLEQLLLNDNINICKIASFLYKKFKNIDN